MFHKICLYLTLILNLVFWPLQNAQAQDSSTHTEPEQYVHLTSYTDKDAIVAGESFRIAFKQSIHSGWHTYWINPGDSGAETRLEWDPVPEGVTAGDIQWPTPERLPYDTLVNFGYSDEAYFIVDVEVADTPLQQEITLSGEMHWLVCKDICIPESQKYQITLPVAQNANPIHNEVFDAAEKQHPLPVNWPALYYEDKDDFVFEITTLDIQRYKSIKLFPQEWGLINNAGNQNVRQQDQNITIRIPRGDRDIAEVEETSAILKVTHGDGKTIGYHLEAKHDSGSAPVQTTASSQFSGAQLIGQIFLAILGGLILNLMPCVFPILSLKALGLAQTKGHSYKDNALHGFSYTAGILISFGVIAAIILSLRSASETVGWGFQLQNPITTLLLAFLMFTIGLSLSGVFEITGKFTSAGNSLTQKSNLSGSFFTGILATLVATPCSAPFMAGAIGFAMLQPTFNAVLIFLAVGFGLALPYLILTLVPASQNIMPKPGAWMKNFKEFLAFPMYITAAWLLWVLGQQAGNDSIFIALTTMVLFVVIFWVSKIKIGRVGLVAFLVYIVLAGTSVYLLPKSDKGLNPVPYTPQALNNALETDDPVFVNMTAAWCITCKINERVAIKIDSTIQAFKSYNVTYIYGDWTNEDENITKYLASFQRNGVPLYVYYPPRDPQTGARPEPIVLPQILTPNSITNTLTTYK